MTLTCANEEKVKPEYIKLTDETEMSKCLHGQIRNANESFNALIWESSENQLQ